MSSGAGRTRTEAEQISRRRMRKGTKSCLPCRSRKVRCNYPLNSHVCSACLAHGRKCTEQTYQDVKSGDFDRRIGLKQRVRELETLVQRLVEKGSFDAQDFEGGLPAKNAELLSPPDSTTSRSQANESTPIDPTEESLDLDESSESGDSLDDVDVEHGSHHKAPLMALFDNNLLLRDDPQDAAASSGQARREAFGIRRHGTPPKARETKITEELRAMFPPWSAINAMLEHGSETIAMWQDLILENSFFGISSVDGGIRKMSQSDQAVELCKGLTFLALIMQQTPESESWRNVYLPKGETQLHLTQKYLETVEAHLCAGHSVISCLDGLECALLMCRILFNEGRPRKAWLLYQRALSYARLLGFHRSASWKTADPSIGLRRQQTWWFLFIGDRAVSLILGLPYSVMDSHVGIDPSAFYGPLNPSRSGGPNDLMNSFSLRLAVTTGRIIDRNQNTSAPASTMYADTMKIDGELHSLEANMPKTWLALGAENGDIAGFIKMGTREIFEALSTLSWYNECRIALHMPYLMRHAQDGDDEQFEYNRTVALESARSIIRSQLRVRTRPELSNVICQVVDFQVFMSTVLLLLDLLSRAKDTGMPRLLKADAESRKDELLTRDSFLMLQRMARLKKNKTNVPAQSLKVLETLGCLIQGRSVPGSESGTQRIVIPYFGSITIKATKGVLEHQKAVRAHMDTFCKSQSQCGGEGPVAEDDAVAESSTSQVLSSPQDEIDPTMVNAAPTNLIFNSFLMPQYSSEPNPTANNYSTGPAEATNQGYNTSDWAGDSDQVMETIIPTWDETAWQNMLTQYPTADLDMDWDTLLAGL